MKPLDELTAHCIRCGFCLESCPTFILTGEETESPRGRIYLVRSANEGVLEWEHVRLHLDRCLGCRACETACPSGVEYGQISEIARGRLEGLATSRVKKGLLEALTSPGKTRLLLKLGGILPGRRLPSVLSKLLSGESAEADRPVAQKLEALPPLDEADMPPVRGEVYLLEGCVMRVLYPLVHEATRRLLRRVGFVVRETEQGCCGSLHLHAGYLDDARERATNLTATFRDGLPIIVNSAGCGSTMKEYEGLIGDAAFAAKVFDAAEFLHANGLVDALRGAPGLGGQDRRASPAATTSPNNQPAEHSGRHPERRAEPCEVRSEGPRIKPHKRQTARSLNLSPIMRARVTYHDACHLAHGQGVRSQPRELLEAIPGIELVDLKEGDVCCGSAGIYNLTQPKMARELLERKWKNIETTGADIVALGNPGCHAWIGQAARERGGRVKVLHTIEILEAAFSGPAYFGID